MKKTLTIYNSVIIALALACYVFFVVPIKYQPKELSIGQSAIVAVYGKEATDKIRAEGEEEAAFKKIQGTTLVGVFAFLICCAGSAIIWVNHASPKMREKLYGDDSGLANKFIGTMITDFANDVAEKLEHKKRMERAQRDAEYKPLVSENYKYDVSNKRTDIETDRMLIENRRLEAEVKKIEAEISRLNDSDEMTDEELDRLIRLKKSRAELRKEIAQARREEAQADIEEYVKNKTVKK